MINILARCKVGKDVKSDDGDHLYPQVALYYEYDPDDPTPLFGDKSPEAVDTERMLLDDMTVRGSNAGAIRANINRMRCAAFRAMEKSEATRHKGSDESVKIQKERTDAFWYGNKTRLLELKEKNTSYVEIFREWIRVKGTWPTHNPRTGYCPDATTIRKWVKKFLEEDSS